MNMRCVKALYWDDIYNAMIEEGCFIDDVDAADNDIRTIFEIGCDNVIAKFYMPDDLDELYTWENERPSLALITRTLISRAGMRMGEYCFIEF